MKVLGKVSLIVGLLLLLSACQTSNLKDVITPSGQEPVRTIPVDVQSKYINVQALEPLAHEMTSGNLFTNSGFESGLEGWTACSTGAIKPSDDAFEGSGALEIIPNNCFYRSAEVSAGQDLVLSCYVKVIEGSGWTGMGVGFADSSWTTVGEAPATVISGSSYARYDVEFTAPANTKYASMWIFSENKAVVDNCSLMLESTPPPPPPPSGDNLLENGDFETLANGLPTEWSVGCGGTATSVTGRSGKGFSLTGGVCVDQGLSAGDVAALSNNDYTYSCYAKNTGGYASLSIFFNDSPKSVVIPVSNSYQLIELKGTAPQASSGFVSIYSEGNFTVDQCSLTAGDVAPPPPPPPPSGDNLLENGGFETLNANSKPISWNKGCGGSYSRVVGRSGNGLSLSGGACVDQVLSNPDLSTLAGKPYTYSCYAKNTGGYASMSIFFDDVPVSTVIPQSNEFQLVEVKGTTPNTSSSFVSIYSEAGLTVDDCSVTVEDAQPVTCVDPVNIPDPALEERLLRALRGGANNLPVPLTCENLANLTAFSSNYTSNSTSAPITSLEGIQYLTSVNAIELQNHSISDLTPLENLTTLRFLDLYGNGITDIAPIANLTNLVDLKIGLNNITNISSLMNLSNLIDFNFGGNGISDISVLANFTNLVNIIGTDNAISDVSALENLPRLARVILSFNNISDISPFVNNLNFLDARSDSLSVAVNCLDLSDPQIIEQLEILENRNALNSNVSAEAQKDCT